MVFPGWYWLKEDLQPKHRLHDPDLDLPKMSRVFQSLFHLLFARDLGQKGG